MKQWLFLFVMAMALSVSGCFSSPTSPGVLDPLGTSAGSGSGIGYQATPTPTPDYGGGVFATPTPRVGTNPTPTPSGSITTYSVTYQVIATDCMAINATYLDSNTTSQSLSVPSTWSQTVTISSGYEAQIVAAYGGQIGMAPTLRLNILVNGTQVATQYLNGFGAAITCSYWLP